MDLVNVNGGCETFQPFYISVPQEHINVLTNLALLGEYTVAESRMHFPKRIQHIPHGREIGLQ